MANNIPKDKADQYLKEKAAKKKTGNKVLWIFLFFCAIAVSVVVKISVTGSLKPEFMGGLPGSSDAYDIAKEFIRPTLASSSANFSDEHYQFAQKPDSTYIIQSSVETRDNSGEKITTEFKIILKYKGGQADKQKNWSLVDLSTH